jgi:hypothetical protein
MRGSEPETAESAIGRSASRKNSKTSPSGDSSISAEPRSFESKSQLCSSRSRERQRPPDRHTRRRGRRYVERAFAFLRRASVSAVAAREVFSKRPAGRDRVSPVRCGVPTFSRSAPDRRPPFFRRSRARAGVRRARASPRASRETTAIGTIERDDDRGVSSVLLATASRR